MRRKPFLAVAYLFMLAFGLLAAAVVFTGASDKVAPSEPGCVVLNTGCWSELAWAYNDPDSTTDVVADTACSSSNVMNFVWCNEYEGTHFPLFVNFGHGGGFDSHLISIYRAAAKPSTKTLIYFNAPGALTNFVDSKATLAASLVLERVRTDYPEAAAEAETYLHYLYGSVGYQEAVVELGPDWRRRVDPETFEFIGDGEPATGCPAVGPAAEPSFSRRAFALTDWSVDRLSHLSFIRAPKPRLSPTFEKNGRLIQLLDGCAARYRHPGNDVGVRRLMKKEDFWSCSGGDEVWRAWVGIVGKICRARGIRFVYYIPPHPHVTPTEYRESFRPAYVDVVKEAFAAYPGVAVVDQSTAPGFNAADLVWWKHYHGARLKAGYLFNAVGRLKEARLLVGALVAAGALGEADLRSRYLGSAWAGEARLPPGPSETPYVSADEAILVRELMLEPEYRDRSRQIVAFDPADR